MIPFLHYNDSTEYTFLAFYTDGWLAMRYGDTFDVFEPHESGTYNYNGKSYRFDPTRSVQRAQSWHAEATG